MKKIYSIYYGVAIKETQEKLLTEEFTSREEAEKKVKEFEDYDRLCGRYEPDIYCIVMTVYEAA